MAVATTDKKKKAETVDTREPRKKRSYSGRKLEGKELEEQQKVWTDIEESVQYAYKHPCKV